MHIFEALTVERQISPKQIFFSSIEFLKKQQVEIPAYYILSEAIRNAFNLLETAWTTQLSNLLNQKQIRLLDQLTKDDSAKTGLSFLTSFQKLSFTAMAVSLSNQPKTDKK